MPAQTDLPATPRPEPARSGDARPRGAARHAWLWIAACAVGFPVLLVVAGALAERLTSIGAVVGGVEIAGHDVSGDDVDDVVARVQRAATRLETTPVRVRIGPSEQTVSPQVLGLHVDVDATVRRAHAAGRGHDPVAVLTGTVLRRFRPDDVALAVRVDDARLAAVLDAWGRATATGLRDGSVRLEGTEVVEEAPRSGTGLREAEAREQLLAAWGAGRTGPVRLSYGPVRPDVRGAEVRRAASEVRALLARPRTVVVGTAAVPLPAEQFAPTIRVVRRGDRLRVVVDPDALHAALAPGLAGVERPAVDATWSTDGETAAVVPSVEGATLRARPLARALAGGALHVTGRLRTIPPAHDTAWAESLHVTELVSTFTTSYPCCQDRVTNIHRAVEALDGAIVLPGDTFSLNDRLGPRTLEKGYVAAPAIGEDLGFVQDVGGGVSQVSTTLFNATYFGGYVDVTHEVHAIYLSRYPMGREATLNYPSIDNRFRNDTDAGVLIRASVTGTSVTISYYGSKAGRSVTTEGPEVLETIPPEVDVSDVTDDPTLLPGTEHVDSEGKPGYVVENIRVISRPGQPDVRQRFVARYAAVPTKVRRNPTPAPPPVPVPPAPEPAATAPPAG